ncbi:hypothetical protein [Prosthecobacter sp.]|uniref:hypothetical protein n=1 Tax=Prosthecobacter sp. TaxID=1965333 RepID=UPI0037841CCE
MKTKLSLLLAAALTLGSVSSCVAPYGYGGPSSRRPYYRSYGSYSHGTSLGGYRGGGAGGGFGGSFGGFAR